jgi:peptidoglycan/LPS O-acetylase OafA/YrhL
MNTGAGANWPARRRPELDLMRGLVVAGLVVFHAAVVFAAGASWFVKDPAGHETTPVRPAMTPRLA